MIERHEVDALQYGDVVRLEINGKVLEGPVTGQGGFKRVQTTTLRLSDGSVGRRYVQVDFDYKADGRSTAHTTTEISTGYPEWVLQHGTLTVLSRRHQRIDN